MTVFRSDPAPFPLGRTLGERQSGDFGAAFTVACPEVVASFELDGALGVVLIDASPLLRIEEVAGPSAFRRAFEMLGERVQIAAHRVLGKRVRVTSGLGDDAQLLVFVHRPREDGAFYAETLPAGAQEMRRLLEGQVRRVSYPYLTGPAQLGVGHGFALWRPFQRPESQLRRLLESAFTCAKFERERMRRERQAEFERILLEKRITCHYEPIVQIKDLTVIGYEGLARGPAGTALQHPIPLFDTAEAVGLDYELDCLCRELALRGARDLPRGAKLFLNCLPASVHDPVFQPPRIREALEGLGLGPADLVLEISERQAITSYAVFRDAIATFAELGFGIAVDDMGAGYSSLATALELRPGFLKIDRSLITGIDGDPPRQELVRAMQVLAQRTGAVVVAEGIESEAELEVLSQLGVDCGQGFLFGRGGPLPSLAGPFLDELDTPSRLYLGREPWTDGFTPGGETAALVGAPQDAPEAGGGPAGKSDPGIGDELGVGGTEEAGATEDDEPDTAHTLGKLNLRRAPLAAVSDADSPEAGGPEPAGTPEPGEGSAGEPPAEPPSESS